MLLATPLIQLRNSCDKLTINELRYALKQAVRGGLQLAIFNSCDGLGLARQLEDLHIPQIIVMQEPVPDVVAQEFLKNFLTKFSGGEPLYLAVRESRERLHNIEDECPCAHWLPTICQNPAALPLAWKDLLKKPEPKTQSYQPDRHEKPWWRSFQIVLLASAIVTSLGMGARALGLLQTWELKAFDQLLRLRPNEEPDSRLLIVTIAEDDFKLPQQQQRKGSLSDQALALLVQKLEPHQPRAIGLDIYHDFPVASDQAYLATQLQRNNNFIAICKVSEAQVNEPGVAPPPEIPIERQGFSDFVKDPDGILRRHLIAMKPGSTSPCTTPYAFSAQLAFRYLEAEGISAKYTQTKELQIDKVIFKRLRSPMGGYQKVDDLGYQILLNYRSYRSFLELAEQVTLKDVLTGSLKPEAVKNRIVLIGVSAQSAGDFFPTPYTTGQQPNQKLPGVVVHAQMVSQILSAVLDGRPLLWVWPAWGEALWIFCWSVVGGILAWRIRNPLRLGLAGIATLGVLYGLCFSLIAQGGWVPLVPSALVLVATGGCAIAYTGSQASDRSTSL